jgi:MFS family permease
LQIICEKIILLYNQKLDLKNKLKIMSLWFAIWAILRLALLLPHRYMEGLAFVNTALQLLLCVLCLQIVKNTSGREKYAYLNFAIIFGFGLLLFANSFTTSIFPKDCYGSLYYFLYVSSFGQLFALLLVIIYALVDYMSASLTVVKKYLFTITITLVVLFALFSRFLINPFQLYEERDYADFRFLEKSYQAFLKEFNRDPNDLELATKMLTMKGSNLNYSEDGYNTALKTVKELYPTLREGGETNLFWKPIFVASIYANGICLLLIAIFLYFVYRYDNPYAPYIEKIMILFFCFCILEIIHKFAFIHTHSFDDFHALFRLGQYITICCFIVMVYAFDLNLRFVHSSTGKYYEQVRQSSPGKITRWIDELDRLVIKSFFTNNKISRNIGFLANQNKIKKTEGDTT